MSNVELILCIVLFIVVGVPSILLSLEMFLGQVKLKTESPKIERKGGIILIPAHNEDQIIADTLKKLKIEISPLDKILVVADNCTDTTVSICEQYGVDVIQRFDENLRGKGYALDFGIKYIQDQLMDEIQTIVIFDADCEFVAGGLDILINRSQSTNRVVQSMYLMQAPQDSDPKIRISEFAWMVKNRVRALGRSRLGISCQLQGSGMAFPFAIFDKISVASGNLVEDLELGIELAKIEEKVLFEDKAIVLSYFPYANNAVNTQRTRWEHGNLLAILTFPKMLLSAITKGRINLFWLIVDASIPPTILWLLSLLALSVISTLLMFFSIFYPTIIIFLCFILLAIGILISWFMHGRDLIKIRNIIDLLGYVFKKFSIYSTFITARQKVWVRTDRGDSSE